jgi:hypothetical protein
MVNKIFVVMVFCSVFISCSMVDGYKPLTLSKEDLQNMFQNPTETFSDSNLMEQLLVFGQLEEMGDQYLFACAADYDSKKQYISKQSPWGIYYKKIGKDEYDIIVDMAKFMEAFKNL